MKAKSLAVSERLEVRQLLSATLVTDFSHRGVRPESLRSNPYHMVFSGWTQETGRELWTSDGTKAGTRLLIDLVPGTGSGYPDSITLSQRSIFFTATGTDGKVSVYRSDGSRKSTSAVYPLASASSFANPIDVGNGVIAFQAKQANGSYALIFSDGSIKGTRRVLGDLPLFEGVVASPGLGAILGRASGKVFYSDGTSKGSRELKINSASRLGQIGGSTQHLYFGAEIERGSGKVDAVLYLVDHGVPKVLRTLPSMSIAGDGTDPYVWVATVGESIDNPATWYRYEGEAAKRFDGGPIVSSVDGGGTLGNEVVLTTSNHEIWISDEKTGRVNYETELFHSKIYTAVATKSEFYFLTDVGNRSRTIQRYDGVQKTMTTISTGSISIWRRGDDEDGLQVVNGRLIYREKGDDGETDLFAYNLSSGLIDRLGDSPGGASDSDIAGFADVKGSSVIVVGVPRENRKRIVLVHPGGSVDEIGSMTNVVNSDSMTVYANEKTAYLGFSSESRYVVLAVDVARKRIQKVFEAEGVGTVLGFDGSRLYFAVEPSTDTSSEIRGAIYVTSGRLDSTHVITGSSFSSVRKWHMYGSQLIVVGNAEGYDAIGPTEPSFTHHSVASVTAPLSTFVQTLSSADGALYLQTRKELLRLSNGSLTKLLSITDVDASFTDFTAAVVATDKQWLYASACRRIGNDWSTWKIIRVDLTDPAHRFELVAGAENDSRFPLPTKPILTAASGGGMIIRALSPERKNTYLRLQDGFVKETIVDELQAIHQTPFGIILQWSVGDVVRLDPITGREHLLDGVEAKRLVTTSYGLQFIGKTAKTGKEVFRYRFDTKIGGTLFEDVNANLIRDPSEGGLNGWRVYIDRNDNGRYDRGEISTLTDSSGEFLFDELDAGTHKLRVSTGANYRLTTGSVYTVRLSEGATIRKRFGARSV